MQIVNGAGDLVNGLPPLKWNNETYGIFMSHLGEILDAMGLIFMLVSAVRVWDAVTVRRRGIEYALNPL